MNRFRINSILLVILTILHWTSVVIEASIAECKKEECWVVNDDLVKKHGEDKKKINDRCKIKRIQPNEDNGNIVDINSWELVIDPCTDEENRNFMECVLDYIPPTNTGGATSGTEVPKPANTNGESTNAEATNATNAEATNGGTARQGPSGGTDEGTCQCYRQWSAENKRSPAYNHSMNPAVDAYDWFLYNETYGECVVKNRAKCAPLEAKLTPYRCQWVQSSQGIFKEGRCKALGVDPKYKICTVEGAASRILPNLPKSFHLILICFLFLT